MAAAAQMRMFGCARAVCRDLSQSADDYLSSRAVESCLKWREIGLARLSTCDLAVKRARIDNRDQNSKNWMQPDD